MVVGHTNIRKTHISKTTEQPNRIFGKLDIENMVWCPSETVSEALAECGLIAAKLERVLESSLGF